MAQFLVRYQIATGLIVFFTGISASIAAEPGNLFSQPSLSPELAGKPLPACILTPRGPYKPDDPPREKFGAWNSVLPASDGGAIGNILGMQTVHTLLLPSGKILVASGSSWRNVPPVEYYPDVKNPAVPKGAFIKADDPFNKKKLGTYYEIVNNVGIYDPQKNTFYRIPHPYPVDDPDDKTKSHFAPNDLFCTGQMHLPNGNVLFTGGTQYYTPYRTGNRSTWQFDWREELKIDWTKVDWRQPLIGKAETEAQGNPWKFSGFMKRGRWYPTIVPLLDGRMAVFSGFVGFDAGYPDMYQFEINSLVEFFDPSAFQEKAPQAAWESVDVKTKENSPFTVKINENFKPSPDTYCPDQCVRDNQYDSFKLYPHNYRIADNKIYLTREGDWVSLRTCDTAYMRKTKHTYLATILEEDGKPEISFTPAPERPDFVSSYGTSFVDPNSGEIRILGGQPTSQGTLYPINSDNPTHFAGGRGSRKLETFSWPKGDVTKGNWKNDPDFISEYSQDDRTMHYALALPTKQILVLNGGNYDFYGPIYYPLLMSPTYSHGKFTGYTKQRLAEALEPRLYHNTAVLLPDGRVFVSGGNTARATFTPSDRVPPADASLQGQPKPDLTQVNLNIYFFNDGPVARGEQGMLTMPTENWTAEIFSPPYMFIDAGRQATIASIVPKKAVDYQYKSTIGGKDFYLLHSGQTYDIQLDNLPPAKSCSSLKPTLQLIKLPSATHGWENGQEFVNLPFDESREREGLLQIKAPMAKQANIPPAYYMMFYVDCHGKPSIASMVRFDDKAMAP